MSQASLHDNITACDQCDTLHSLAASERGQRLRCAQCGCVVVNVHEQGAGRLVVASCSALFMLVFASAFPFLSFSSSGASRSITLFDLVEVLIQQDFLVLGILISLALFVFPVVYLVSVVFLVTSFRYAILKPFFQGYFIRWIVALQPWLMLDVFLIGALVALIKMDSFSEVRFDLSFFAFCVYAVLLLKTVSLIDRRWLWRQVSLGQVSVDQVSSNQMLSDKVSFNSGQTARQLGFVGCHFCGLVLNGAERRCVRCGHSVHSRRPHSLSSTIALLVAAAVMFLPANFFPIMQTTFLGSSESSTLVGGVLLLWSLGSYPVAMVIFLASVVIPIAKILSLSWLCWQYYYPTERETRQKIRLYRITELVGRWSMIDIFVVAVLTVLVQLGELVSISPGPAALPFAATVVFTMLAAMTFDPRLLWDKTANSSYLDSAEKPYDEACH